MSEGIANRAECLARSRVNGSHALKGPERVDGPHVQSNLVDLPIASQRGEGREGGGIPLLNQQTLGMLAPEQVGMAQGLDPFGRSSVGEARLRGDRAAVVGDPIDAAVAFVA